MEISGNQRRVSHRSIRPSDTDFKFSRQDFEFPTKLDTDRLSAWELTLQITCHHDKLSVESYRRQAGAQQNNQISIFKIETNHVLCR